MFETDIDGEGIACDHPIRWFHRLAAWAHRRIERFPFTDREQFHDRLPDWICESSDRIEYDFPCRKCEADRTREYGATTKTDADVAAKFPQFKGCDEPAPHCCLCTIDCDGSDC